MDKVFKLSKEHRKIASQSRISLSSVYSRLGRGWKLEDAISIPTGYKKRKSSETRSHFNVTFKTFMSDYENFVEAVNESGLSTSEFMANVVRDWLRLNGYL